MTAAAPASDLFVPSRERAEALAAAMRARLADSLEHIAERSAPHIAVDEPAVAAAIARLRQAKLIDPEAFGIHADMLAAIEADDLDRLAGLFAELAAHPLTVDELTISVFGSPDRPASRWQRYRRYASTDPDVPLDFVTPDPELATEAAARVRRALAMMDAHAPGFGAEVRALVPEIVLTTIPEGARLFEGVSTFPLWGAIFANPKLMESDLDTVELVAHECAHAMLFACSIDEPLVANPNSDRYASPVREDLRPMDGIIHGAVVLARLHLLLVELLDAGAFDAELEAEARRRLPHYPPGFVDGLEVIDAHADFTPTGSAIFEATRAYMAGA